MKKDQLGLGLCFREVEDGTKSANVEKTDTKDLERANEMALAICEGYPSEKERETLATIFYLITTKANSDRSKASLVDMMKTLINKLDGSEHRN